MNECIDAAEWGVEELLLKYPELRLHPSLNGNTTIAGRLESSRKLAVRS